MEETKPTKTIFCAKCQLDLPHTYQLDSNGEIVLTCTACNGFIKLPAGLSVEEIQMHVVRHKQSNIGQRPIGPALKTLEEWGAIPDEVLETAPQQGNMEGSTGETTGDRLEAPAEPAQPGVTAE